MIHYIEVHYTKQMSRINKQRKKTSGRSAGPAANPLVRLRSLRMARKMTLSELSHAAGVSKAMLSQIEQDKVNPTVAVMIKIANALGVGVAELIDEPGSSEILRVIRAAESSYTYRSDRDCLIRTLSPLSLEKSIEFYRVVLQPGGQLRSEPHFPGTQEFLYVAKGRLAVVSGDKQEQLRKGDAVHYRADVPHVIRNVGRGAGEAYMIVHYRSQ